MTAALPERDHRLVRAGQVILAVKGFAGREFEAYLTERLGVHLVRPDRRDEPLRHGKIARVRLAGDGDDVDGCQMVGG